MLASDGGVLCAAEDERLVGGSMHVLLLLLWFDFHIATALLSAVAHVTAFFDFLCQLLTALYACRSTSGSHA